MPSRTALLAAGGTGGHLFPAEALAHELTARGWTIHLATDERANRYVGRFPATAVHALPSATIGGRNPVALVRSGLTIWRGVRQASTLLKRVNAAVAVGFGGYPTLPPVWAATRRGIPTVIHEQNAVMGRANRALAFRVSAIAGGFLPEADARLGFKTVVTGNPVRPAVLDASKRPYVESPDGQSFNLLVFGGSQGAQFFSQAIPSAVALMAEPQRRRLRVVQQARAEDEAAVRAAYAGLGVAAEVSPFFTDMADRIATAQLVISRSGASTVSEIAAIGRPAMLVPYPHALDHDQAANAAALAANRGADVYPQSALTPEKIAAYLTEVMDEPHSLHAMALAARETGRPDAARLLADLTEAIAEGMNVQDFKRNRAQGTRP
jgi:UDP-N-acetylglucosamine--N-acetylmuramyl-(pentapeptide) pyrophosphoryl-undecaprenol N-acetylglucosamine transferase